ncbi:MAG: hypothetical protein P1V36_02045 [Planctomycetota bacterium]|nr:hypothetical protein [Planctomycetota bacterium]
MVIGTTIFYLDGNAYHSPTFSRGGLAATFSVDVTHLSLGAGVGLGIEVQHRNDEDTTWSSAGTFSSITSVDTYSKDISGLKENVRFVYTFQGGTPTALEAAHFLMMAPSWRPY